MLLSIIFGCTKPGKEESATLNHQTLNLKLGQIEQLTVILPANAKDTSVTWESSAPDIVFYSLITVVSVQLKQAKPLLQLRPTTVNFQPNAI